MVSAADPGDRRGRCALFAFCTRMLWQLVCLICKLSGAVYSAVMSFLITLGPEIYHPACQLIGCACAGDVYAHNILVGETAHPVLLDYGRLPYSVCSQLP